MRTKPALPINARTAEETGRPLSCNVDAFGERERDGARLREYEKVVESTEEMIVVVDRDYRYLLANRAFLRYRRKERDDVVGRFLWEVVEADVFQSVMKPRLDESFAGHVVSSEMKNTYHDGGTRYLLVSYFPIEGAGGIDRVACVLRDITERKQVQEALRQSEAQYRELFENARDAIYVHNLNGRYISVNRAAEELSGYTRDEILGKHYSNFVRPTHLKAVRENFCRKLDVPVETTYETVMACKDGTRRPVEVSSRIIYRNGEPAGVQGTVRDITERKLAQRALQTYSRRLVHAQEAERELIGRELHDDIGQALMAIGGNLESIQRSGALHESAVPRLRESIEAINRALRRVRELSAELRPVNEAE